MKLFLPIALALACVALAISLIVMKQGDNARQESDAGAIADFSNRLASAQSEVAARDGTILTFSNRLDEGLSASLAWSNRLTEAQAAMALDREQITNLNRRVAEAELEHQAAGRRVQELTNQLAGLTAQIALTRANLAQTNQALVQAYKDYGLLENRFRIDVAERTVVERKFNNPLALRAQMRKLKQNPGAAISAESIYADLNVEVKSNGTCHVIAPN